MATPGQEKNMRTTEYAPTTPTARTRGLTLIELMVSMAIIVIIVLAVGQIMSSAQKIVSVGQASMRANSKVGALKTAIRDDLRRASKMGFLYIDCPDGVHARLAFVTAGPSESIVGGGTGNGAVVLYAPIDYDLKSSDDPKARVLSRIAYALNNANQGFRDNSTPNNLTNLFKKDWDYGLGDLAHVQTDFGSQIANAAWLVDKMTNGNGDNVTKGYSTDKMNVYQADLGLADITNDSWKVMTAGVTKVTVEWTTGPGGGDLIWSSTPNCWTNANPNDWPKAIRYTITMEDDPQPYEVICPVGQ